MKTVKTVFRFGDLYPGEAFYTKSEPYRRLIVASDFIGGWFGITGRIPLSCNAEVIPTDPRGAAFRKRAYLKEVASRHGLTVKEIQEEYRVACASKPYTDYDGSKSTAIVAGIPETARAALEELGLIHHWTNYIDGQHHAVISGEYPRRLYI